MKKSSRQLLAGFLFIVAAVVTLVVAVAMGTSNIATDVGDLRRLVLPLNPGSVTLPSGEQVVYLESDEPLPGLSPVVRVLITRPDGETVAAAPDDSSSYEESGLEGRSLGRFTAPVPGNYTFEVRTVGDIDPEEYRLAIGKQVSEIAMVAIVAFLVALVLGLAGIFLVIRGIATFVKEQRGRFQGIVDAATGRQPADPELTAEAQRRLDQLAEMAHRRGMITGETAEKVKQATEKAAGGELLTPEMADEVGRLADEAVGGGLVTDRTAERIRTVAASASAGAEPPVSDSGADTSGAEVAPEASSFRAMVDNLLGMADERGWLTAETSDRIDRATDAALEGEQLPPAVAKRVGQLAEAAQRRNLISEGAVGELDRALGRATAGALAAGAGTGVVAATVDAADADDPTESAGVVRDLASERGYTPVPQPRAAPRPAPAPAPAPIADLRRPVEAIELATSAAADATEPAEQLVGIAEEHGWVTRDAADFMRNAVRRAATDEALDTNTTRLLRELNQVAVGGGLITAGSAAGIDALLDRASAETVPEEGSAESLRDPVPAVPDRYEPTPFAVEALAPAARPRTGDAGIYRPVESSPPAPDPEVQVPSADADLRLPTFEEALARVPSAIPSQPEWADTADALSPVQELALPTLEELLERTPSALAGDVAPGAASPDEGVLATALPSFEELLASTPSAYDEFPPVGAVGEVPSGTQGGG